jgi:hypothetical protein
MLRILIGLLVALFYSKVFLPKHTGFLPRIHLTIYPILYEGMVLIPISNKKAIHIHHWIICLGLILLLSFFKSFGIIFGIVLGLFIQGLLYKDSLNIIQGNHYVNNYVHHNIKN